MVQRYSLAGSKLHCLQPGTVTGPRWFRSGHVAPGPELEALSLALLVAECCNGKLDFRPRFTVAVSTLSGPACWQTATSTASNICVVYFLTVSNKSRWLEDERPGEAMSVHHNGRLHSYSGPNTMEGKGILQRLLPPPTCPCHDKSPQRNRRPTIASHVNRWVNECKVYSSWQTWRFLPSHGFSDASKSICPPRGECALEQGWRVGVRSTQAPKNMPNTRRLEPMAWSGWPENRRLCNK